MNLASAMGTDANQRCSKCGAPVRFVARAGLCPRCMLAAGLSECLERSQVEADTDGAAKDSKSTGFGRLSRYELVEEIARGGMGVVYRARDTALNRTVALKMIVTGQFASEPEVKRFRAEAEAAARLDHPNIVPIYEVGEEGGRPFFSMKFMEGGTLTARLAAGESPFGLREAAGLLVKIARAVHHAHQHAILHRDIKPGNILLDANDEPHVSDFGLAKCLDSADRLTLSGATIGSPSYMSPEQAAGHSERLTTASDTYSLGALLYELVTGRPPFQAATPLATMEKVLREEPPRPRTLREEIDRDLETICLKCLEKEPSRRYGSAETLANDLEHWLRHEPIRARPSAPAQRLGKWIRRNPGVALLTLVALLATIGFVVGLTIMSIRVNRANTEIRATNTRLGTSLYELRWRQADEGFQTAEQSEAIAWLAYLLRQNPSDSVAASRLLSVLSSRNFPIPVVSPLLHEGAVIKVAFSRAGDRLATIASKTARVWNVRTGQAELELAHPALLTHAVLCGPSDQRLLTITSELEARLWDLNTRQMIKEIRLDPMDERLGDRLVLTTRDRRLVAMNVRSNAVAVLEADTGEWMVPPLRLPTEIQRFALSYDGRLLATASGSELQIWDSKSKRPIFPSTKISGPAADLRFSDDGHWLACLAREKVRVMSTVTGSSEPEFSAKATELAFVGDEALVVGRPVDATPYAIDGALFPFVFNIRTGQDCGSAFGHPEIDWLQHPSLAALLFLSKYTDRLRLLDPANGQPLAEPFFHDGWIKDWQLDAKGQKVATASQDRTVRIWSIEMRRLGPITLDLGGPVWEAQWSPSGDKILTGSVRDGRPELGLWRAQDGTLLRPAWDSGDVIYAARWAPDESRFATASAGWVGRIWNGLTGEAISPPLRHDGGMDDCAFSPNGEVLATTGDRTVRLWDGHTGKTIAAPLVHSSTPLAVTFASDGRRLATAALDGTIRVWSVPDGALVLGPLHHDGTCWGAVFSPDNRLLLSASSDGTARLWNAATGELALPPFRHEGPVLGASFRPDGRAIVTSTESGIARVWDTATGQALSPPMRHPGKVWIARWSADGRFLVTTCTDGSARIWDASTGHLAAEPFSHEKGKEVRRADWSPDGRRLLTASFDGTVKIWDLVLLRPPLPAPSWLPDLAESLAGRRIGSKDAPESVPGDGFLRVKQRIAQAGSNDDYYTRWARWMLEQRLQRPVKPFQP